MRCVSVAESVPFEQQCLRDQGLDITREDPMREECIPQGPPTPEHVAGEERLDPPARPLLTYKRRPKSQAGPSRAALISPTRLDFDTVGATASPPVWAMLSPRSPSRGSKAAQRSTTQPRTQHSTPNASITEEPVALASPPRTPSTAAAMAATSAFLASITLATQSPLISAVPTEARAAFPPTAPTPGLRRSGRLASQPLNLTVRPSKKGEILAMKKLGFLEAGSNNNGDIDDARKEFDRFFGEVTDIKNFPPLRNLLPAARGLSDDELMAAARQAYTLGGGQ
nr:unnamed protein product [Digitaria exilis]